MQRVTTIGLDIAKSVFQVHGIDAIGNAVIRRGGTCARRPRSPCQGCCSPRFCG
jgi:hypothetical protein